MPKTPVVFIHGMFMTALCWEEWVPYFEAAGRPSIALEWPGREAAVAELRARHPDPELGDLRLSDVVEDHVAAIEKMAEKPVLVGHSMGGLIVQLLLQKDVAVAGVAIDSAPPSAVFTTQPSFLKSNWPMINPLEPGREPHMITFDEFAYAFANTLPVEEQRVAYDRYAVPESREVPRDSIGHAGHVDFRAPHPPLLLIAGGKDHIIPVELNRSNFKHYHDSPSVTELKEFPDRDHLTITEPGWVGVADYVLEWLDAQSV
jgi:pimeloyl-ACP methyl ester carboxylesterase